EFVHLRDGEPVAGAPRVAGQPMPSYSTLRRHLKAQGLLKQNRIGRRRATAGMLAANERLQSREVRSFELDHVNASTPCGISISIMARARCSPATVAGSRR